MTTMDIGGDDSVAWAVTHDGPLEAEQDQAKRTLHQKHPNKHATNVRKGENYVEGRDPTDTKGKSFTITIKLPEVGADGFLARVRAAATNPPGDRISFTLPIEYQNYDQIHIDW